MSLLLPAVFTFARAADLIITLLLVPLLLSLLFPTLLSFLTLLLLLLSLLLPTLLTFLAVLLLLLTTLFPALLLFLAAVLLCLLSFLLSLLARGLVFLPPLLATATPSLGIGDVARGWQHRAYRQRQPQLL